MGVCVRASSLKLRQRSSGKERLVRLARVPLGLGEGLVTEHRHYFMGCTSCFCEPPASSLAEAMRLALQWKSGNGDRITDPLAEAVDRERLATLRIDYCKRPFRKD